MDSAAGRALRGLDNLDPHLFPPWARRCPPLGRWQSQGVDMAAYAKGLALLK